MENVLKEKSVPIRVPATANLQIDSADRDATQANSFTPWSFTINKKQNILNGFFNRIGATEFVLEWTQPNVSPQLFNNNSFEVTITGAPANPYTVTIPEGFYTVQKALDVLINALNTGTPTNTWALAQGPIGEVLTTGAGGPTFTIVPTTLSLQLGFSPLIPGPYPAVSSQIKLANLQALRYIDVVSNNLTYNQDLKDATTVDDNVQDVLMRFYFAYDEQAQTDAYGYPILMGYEPFHTHRAFNPPKQIKWDKIQPIGQLNFELWGYVNPFIAGPGNPPGPGPAPPLPPPFPSRYLPLLKIYPPVVGTYTYGTNWMMTLQVSEN